MPRAKKERVAAEEQQQQPVNTPSAEAKKTAVRRGRKAETAAPTPVAEPIDTPASPAPTRGRPRKTQKTQIPAPQVAEATPEPQPAAPEAKPRRGRKPKAEQVPSAAEVQEAAVPVAPTDVPAEAAPAEPPRARRGRKPRAEVPVAMTEAVREEAPQEAEGPAPAPLQTAVEPDAAAAPEKPRRGRKPRAAASTEAVPEPGVLPTETRAAESVLLEVPKRRGRKPKSAVQAVQETAPESNGDPEAQVPLGAMLGGVEAVEASVPSDASPEPAAQVGAAPTVTATMRGDTPDPAVDLPLGETETAAVTPDAGGRRNRKPRREPQATATGDEDSSTGPASGEAEGEEAARQLVTAQLRKLGRPIHVRDLERTFTRQMLDRLGNWRDLESLLDELTRTGEVIRTRRRTYGLPEAMSLVRGRFQASAAGFGFVVPDSGGEDFYVAPEHTMEAWNGDTVLVRMEGRGDGGRDGRNNGPRRGQRGDGSPRASVARIVQRAYKQLVGSLELSKGHPILRADDPRARHRILLLPDGLEGLPSGARVVAELFWPEQTGEDEVFGQVRRVLGEQDDPETETEAVIVKYGLRGEFPVDVLDQANAIPAQIPDEALVGRLDLRDFNIFTVDGRDAKDFDDAIHIQPTPEGTFVVGVHIADVSHYVREGTPLDDEAYARATSVYLPGRVLPMLPEHLSNGVCSLVPNEDRLTMTAMVELSAEGEILNVQLAPSVIRSKARLTYDEVQAYSEATATLPDHARHLEGDLHLLLKITTKLRQKRLREGSLDFKLREVKVDVGPDGRMELIPIREETARGMIEDLMLLANKVVAHELLQRDIPALFRIHEEPTLQRFQEVTGAIGRLGLSFPGNEPTPQAYQAVLKQVRGTPREGVVNTLLLRSMQQAKYAGENLGHFGLAFDEYLHFTSPIRRYPDLLVHRVLRGMLSGELRSGGRAVNELRGKLPGMGDHTSDRERAAAEAERDLTKYYQAKWAQEHLGETFTGNVSGVVSSGLFVMLDNGVEGKLHISNLDDDYYIYLEDAQMLRGRSGGRTFRLGDTLTVTISQVNPLARLIDFTQEDTDMDDAPTRPRARRREDREAEKRERLSTITPTAPRKFTLDEPQPAVQSTTPRGQSGQGQGRGVRTQQGRDGGGRDGGSRDSGFQGGRGPVRPQNGGQRPRRVITLERPRNEHLRPVNITVQRMYFGDWTVENMPPDDGQGEGGRPPRSFDRGFDRSGGGRSPGQRYSRGGSDRGAVRDLNGRPDGGRSERSEPPRQDPVPQDGGAAGNDADAKRRRRRRGRRSGNGPQG
ncbi:ribonuclease R [Deinococcus hopiensis]|uniref:Ribonuclease R n=1 Tax=Deinococcus hopiensis KR-140 TaxID=695939 RepID=A0A1W1VNR5_9DEIO|nr:ribonuclease R [Deinococcus hopiensis]SMB95025.1 ribonuclease R [Deinococcus hopiensis KR-140]